jgi:hypothetical protein
MTKNMSIILIAVIAAVMIAGSLAVTVTTGNAYAISQKNKADQSSSISGTQTNTNNGGNAGNGVNGGSNGHDRCDNAGPAEHNKHCQ